MSESKFYAFGDFPEKKGLYDVILDGENGIVPEVLIRTSQGFTDLFNQPVINEPFGIRNHICESENCLCKLYQHGKENV